MNLERSTLRCSFHSACEKTDLALIGVRAGIATHTSVVTYVLFQCIVVRVVAETDVQFITIPGTFHHFLIFILCNACK